MLSQWTRAKHARGMLASWFAVAVLALFATGPAAATQYVYDANGRLVVVTDDSGESARYVYDAMGNILRIERVQASELRIFAMTPSHGTVDTPVSIRGQGFESVAANNTVQFNGVPATVSSATANELKVTVPYAATTGPVTVSVGSRTAASDTPFTVDETGLPPVIGQVSPDIAVVGTSIGIDGSHLYPIPGKTSLRIGGRSLDIGQGTTNQHLAAVLPPSASSGRVSVQTPYGTAESVQSVLVVPAGIDPANVHSRSVATLDTSSGHVDLTDGNSYGAVMFDSEGRSWISLQLANFSGSSGNIGYTVYAPGNVAVLQGTVSANAPSIHLGRLQGAGTYMVLFRPNDGGSSSFDLSAVSNVAFGDDELTLVTQVPSQSVRAIFNAQAKDTLVVKIAGATTEPGNVAVTYSVYTPSGAFYTSGVASGAGSINLPNLPMGGTWQVVAAPGVGVKGSMRVSVIKGTTGVLIPGAAPVSLEAKSPGQNVYMNFHANPFDDVDVTVANATLTDTTQTYYEVHVYAAAGNEVAYTSCYTTYPGGNCNLHLWYMNEGDYQVVVVPYYGGTLHLDATLQKQLTGRTLAHDETMGIDLALGQAERLTFDAKAGDTLAMFISNTRTTPQGQNLRFLVYRPDAGYITTQTRAYTDFSTTGSRVIDLPNLPVTGRYTVIVLPDYGLPVAAQISLLTGTTATLATNAAPITLDTHAPGQSMYVDFDATAGERMELTFTGAVLTNASYGAYQVNIQDAAGRFVQGRTCYMGDVGCQFHLWYLPAGHYRATITMDWGGTFHVQAGIRDVITGRQLAVDTPAHISLDSGNAEHVTFHANAGDTLAFAVNSLTTTPAGQSARYIIYRADAGAIATATPAYTEFSTYGPRLIDLPNLPVTGDYTIAILSDTGVGIDTTVQLISGEVGSLPADGTAGHFDTRGSGQSTYVDFSAYQGENLELSFWNIVQAGASYGAYSVNIRDSAGRNISGTTCYTGDPGCEFHLWNLPAGSYRATITTDWGGTLSFDAAARPHKVLPQLTGDQPVSASFVRGEAGRLTFHANAGDTLALVESGIKTDPVGRNVRFLVYRPDAGTITTSTPSYTDFSRAGDQLLDLPNLPVTGDYTVVILPDYGVPADVKLAIVGGLTGSVPADGAPHTFESNAATQTAYLDFTAARGANLELVFSNVVQTGASYGAYSVDIRDEVGRSIGGTTCYTSDPGCEFHLWALAGGKYRATVSLNWGGSLKFDATVTPNRTGRVLAFDAPASFDLGTGQVERLTFHANAGDTVALQETGIVTAPVGRDVRFLVYRPDVGVITTSTPAYLDFTRSGNQVADLPTLPVTGDYTVMVMPGYGVPAHVRLDLIPGTTGTLVKDALPQTFTVPTPGQTAYLNFHADAFDDLELTLANVPANGSTAGWYRVEVYDATNRQVASATCYYGDPGCQTHLWYLAEGNYRAVVTLNNGAVGQFDAVLTSHKKGVHLSNGDDQAIILGLGQAQRLTFDANAGDTRTLLVQDVLTSPVGRNVRVMVFSPSSGAITNGTGRILEDTASGNRLFTLSNLPVTGTYTVMVLGDYGVAGSLKLTEDFVRSGDTPAPKPANIVIDAASKHFAWESPDPAVSLVFTASVGQNVDFAINNVTGTTGFYLNAYDPSGAGIGSSYCSTDQPACTIDFWNTKPGSYTISMSPSNGTGMAFDAVVRSNPNGGTLQRGTAKVVSGEFGDLIRYTFDASKGETVALYVSDLLTTPQGRNVGVRVYRPDGGLIQPSSYMTNVVTSDRSTININSIPVSGTYTVVVNSDWLMPFTAKLLLVPGVTGSVLTPDATTTHIESNAPAETAWFDVDGGQGGNFELFLNNMNLQDGNSYYTVSLFNSAGVQLDNFVCYSSDPSCSRDMWNLAPGMYRVAVIPQYNTSKPAFDAAFVRNKEKGKLQRGVAADITHGGGDILRYTFDATQGETIGLALSSITTNPGGRNTAIRVYRPDGGIIVPNGAYSSGYTSNVATLNLTDLPATGTYTVLVHSDYLLPGSGQLTLVGAASGAVLTEASPLHAAAKSAGQNVYFDVDVGSGGAYELALSNASTGDGADNYYQVFLYNPVGVQLDSYYCYPSNPSCSRDMWNLAAGRYHVIVQPGYSSSTMSFDATLRAHASKGVLTRNSPADITRIFGQELRYTFQGTTGETVALRVDSPASTPSGFNTVVRVYRPDGGVITDGTKYSWMSGTGAQTLNLPNLPSTGTYTVIVNTDYLIAATGTLTLVDGATGHTLTDGVVTHLEANAAGQNVYFDLDLSSVTNAELMFYGASSNDGGDNYYQVFIFSPAGVQVDNYYCYPSSPGCVRDMWDMPRGVYHVLIQPGYASSRMTFDAVVRANTVKGDLVRGVPADVAHENGGFLRYTFTANAGETLALKLSDITTSPPGLGTYIRVYRPNGGRILPNGFYSQVGARDYLLANLPDLPESGVYTVIVHTDYGVGGGGKLTLVPGVTGIDLSDGAAVHARGNAPGQAIYMDLDVATGGHFELTLSATAQDPSVNYISVALLNAAGAQVDAYYCDTASNCARDYWNLASGHYRVVATPGYSTDQIGFDARFIRNVEGGPLTKDVPVDIAHALGEDLRYTFTAHRKDNLALRLAAASTIPAGRATYVRVYRPDGGLITPDNRYAILGSYGNDTLNLPNLPVDGTYTVIVNSDALSGGQGSLTLTTGTSP
ncbi:IPT/TIG domain-containing protein [Luteibacter aegosomaticola]|uniref:IPT/TIG domain-containing protein n=1 Tax=Luteibacter aegosomaticola TaxID=2911538 RepID=UPI001FF7FF1C|nr:IPT/TIG domain-containing protein [Luteibacter aegosomaticola]UPG91455.1 IPT/TIG domain-containing protein [Luteibacter aegosomaticola]